MGNNFGRIDAKKHRCEVFNVEKINNLSILYGTATFPPVFSQIMDVKSDTLPSLKHIAKTILRGCKGQKICYNSDIYHHNYNGEFMKKIFGFTLNACSANIATCIRNRKAAFTLAEVLITLGIIGVVAAMTMPVIIANKNKQDTIVKVKKVYSVMSQAHLRAVADYGDYEYWDIGHQIGASAYFNKYYKPYLSVLNTCTGTCGYDANIPWTSPNGSRWNYSVNVANYRQPFFLSDGTFIVLSVTEGDPNISASSLIFVDINGSNKPNKLGRDTFVFIRDKTGVRPRGYNVTSDEIDRNCSPQGEGSYCAAKLMKDGWQIKDDYPW